MTRTRAVQCTAPVQGHKPGSEEWMRCPACGPAPMSRAKGGGTLNAAPMSLAGDVSIHRAAHDGFNPEDYTVVLCGDNVGPPERYESFMQQLQWAEGVPHGTQCSHCGARIRYFAVLRHASGEHITVGETCLGNRFEGTAAQFHALRKMGKKEAARLEAEILHLSPAEREVAYERYELGALAAGIEKRAKVRDAMWEDNPGLELITYPEIFPERTRAHSLAVSLMEQLNEPRTSLTGKQIDYFVSTAETELDHTRMLEKREARKAAMTKIGVRAPRGKGIDIEGVVFKVSTYPNNFDPSGRTEVTKLMLALPGGARVSVTAPESIREEVKEGDRVRMKANFDAPKGQDDVTFARGTRPRNAEIVDEQEDP